MRTLQYSFIFLLLLFSELILCPASMAGLEGSWVFSYRTPDGLSITTALDIHEAGELFTAQAVYPLQGKIINDVLEGKIDPSGAVVFTIQRGEVQARYTGSLSKDGRTIRGWYSESSGVGTFSLERASNLPTYPQLTGQWIYVFMEPNSPPYTADCVMNTFPGGRLEGVIHYKGTAVRVPLSGKVETDGSIRLMLTEANGIVVHTGTVSKDQRIISGHWRSDWSSGTFTLTKP